MRQSSFVFVAAVAALLAPRRASGQDNPTGDPIVQRMHDEGMHHSQASRLAQMLMDSIGPRRCAAQLGSDTTAIETLASAGARTCGGDHRS